MDDLNSVVSIIAGLLAILGAVFGFIYRASDRFTEHMMIQHPLTDKNIWLHVVVNLLFTGGAIFGGLGVLFIVLRAAMGLPNEGSLVAMTVGSLVAVVVALAISFVPSK